MSANAIIAKAIASWGEQLIDIGGRNRLLFYKPQRTGTIDFRPNDDADQAVVEHLLAGESVRLSVALPGDERNMRRGRAIRQKSREHEEERGIQTLYLGWWMATWADKPGREPAAPLFLSAVEIEVLGRLGDDFRLGRVDGWEINQSLFHYLATEFQVEWDQDAIENAVADERFEEALDLFRDAASEVSELEVLDRVVLGTFSYARLPLLRDIEGAAQAVEAHPLVAALAGDDSARDKLRNIGSVSFGDGDGRLPDDPPPQDEFLILDADGSQSRVINAALHGQNLVIVGPPGTGKSQTIANLIATLAARGKSTLFVAEKRAAIDAVLKRLNEAQLGDLVLDLHEGVRSRRQTAEQLAKALEAAKHSAKPSVAETHRKVSHSRDALSRLSTALGHKRAPWGESVLELYARQSLLADTEPTPTELRNKRRLRNLKPAALEEFSERVEEYITTGGALLDRDPHHGWSQAHRRRTITSVDALRQVDNTLGDLVDGGLDELQDMIQDFCSHAGVGPLATLEDLGGVLTALKDFEDARADCASLLDIEPPVTLGAFEHLISAMFAYDQRISDLARQTRNRPRSIGEVQDILDACSEYRQTHHALCTELGIEAAATFSSASAMLEMLTSFDRALKLLDRSAFTADLDALSHDLQPATRGPLSRLSSSMFNGAYRRARAELRSLASDRDADLSRLLQAEHARQGRSHWCEIAGGLPVPNSWKHRSKFSRAFSRLRELLDDSDGPLDDRFCEIVAYALEDLRALGVGESVAIPPNEHVKLSSKAAAWRELKPTPTDAAATQHRGRLTERLEAVQRQLRLLTPHVDLGDLESLELGQLLAALDRLSGERALLHRLPRLDELQRSFTAMGIKRFVELAVKERWDLERVKQSLERAWVESVLSEIEASDEAIATFDGVKHSRVAAEYCELDREHIAQGADRVRRAWAEAVITARNAHPEQEETVVRQSKLQRKHKPMRDLVREAPDVLTKLKPCWAMSPLVAPQILPCEPLFDAVIFDEASQILPADAVSSLLRGRQAVIAGDSRQLPPTLFFTSSSDDYDEQDDDADANGATVPLTNDVESVLDAVSALMPGNSRTLSWHYRSRDERLISFSNHHVYDGSLTTFPGALADDCLSHVEVEFSHRAVASGASNSAEVERVVQLILDHAEHRPHESLGVIALGIKHAQRILETLRLERGLRLHLDDFFAEDRPEPFFVKNLERVQGDERDAIILTVGYGRAQDGRMRYNFGPLNREGGYRRLNVAVTRAKRRMTIVSAFSAADMDPDRLRSQGPQMLRDYIAYAASAGRDLGSARRDAEPLNPFEIDIKRRLEAAGIPLQPQYGASGYRIDFAAMHPDQPGRPVLAIEADGASYHSAINARERDRLRQEHLERLGWRFHRIWSTEWFRNPEAETRKAVDAWQTAVEQAELEPTTVPPPPSPLSDSVPRSQPPPVRAAPPAFIQPGLNIDNYTDAQIHTIVRWALSDGLLHTDEELLQVIVPMMGYRRTGHRIRARLERAILLVRRFGDHGYR